MSASPLELIQVLFRVGNLGGLSDGELLDRFIDRRDEVAQDAFSALVERHGAMVLRVCQGVLTDPDDVKDTFQATFLLLARKANSVRDRDSIGGWLFGVALRSARRSRADAARRQAREREGAQRACRTGPGCEPQPDWEAAEDCRILLEEIHRLSARHREAVLLCYLEGHSTEEAARRLGCPRGTVLSRLARARERLKGRLLGRGVSLPTLFGTARILPREAVSPHLIRATVEAAMNPGRLGPMTSLAGLAAGAARRFLAPQVARWLAACLTLGVTLVLYQRLPAEPLTLPRAATPRAKLARRPGPRLDARGILLVYRPGLTVRASSVASLPDGRIVLAAVTGRFGTPEHLYLARFHPDGATDWAFGDEGFVEAGFRPDESTNFAWSRPRVVVQPDGKIVLASSALASPDGGNLTQEVGIQRFRPDGTPDVGFGHGGLARIKVGRRDRDGGRVGGMLFLSGLAVQADGKIVAGGGAIGPNYEGDSDIFALRLDGNGVIDGSFGDSGWAIAPFPVALTERTDSGKTSRIGSRAGACDLALGRDGRIAVGGNCQPIDGEPGSSSDLALAVFGPDGRPDPAFGDGGRLRVDFGSESGAGTTDEVAQALAFADDGDLLVAGQAAPAGSRPSSQAFVLRLDRSGRRVPTFGDRGVAFLTDRDGSQARALLVRRDGAIVVGGVAGRPPYPDNNLAPTPRADLFLARLGSDGRLDPAFGTQGRIREDVRAMDLIEGIAERRDGTLLATGYATDGRSSIVLMPAIAR